MVSSAAAQIETIAGESWTITAHGKILPDYAKVQGVLIGIVIAWTCRCNPTVLISDGRLKTNKDGDLGRCIVFFVCIGPEAHGAHFEEAGVATQAGAGKVTSDRLDHEAERADEENQYDDRVPDKGVSEFCERKP
jgi:SHS family lactate transporter-like MFS transporter